MQQAAKVLKFGGSSVGSAQAMKRVAAILATESEQYRTVGVLSAMYGVTNHLVRATTAAKARDSSELAEAREEVLRLHRGAVGDLLSHAARKDEVMDFVENALQMHFDGPCEEILEKGAMTARHSDEVWSLGERFTNKMVSVYLNEQNHKSVMFESDDVIVTDDVAGGANPLLEETEERVRQLVAPELANGATALVTGYFGKSKEGHITTLGRGGSDLTASVLGYSLDAEAVELYKVECSKTEDGWLQKWEPGFVGIVHDADVTQTLPQLAYEEAATLAHFGKKVLHPTCMEPCMAKGIRVAIKNTMAPQNPGTIVCDNAAVSLTDAALEQLNKEGAAGSSVASQLGLDERNRDDAEASEDGSEYSGHVTTVTKTPLDAYLNAHSSEMPTPEWADSPSDASFVVAVGRQLCDKPDVTAQVVSTLAEHDIPTEVPERINGSKDHFSVLVPSTETKRAVKLIHSTLVEQETASL